MAKKQKSVRIVFRTFTSGIGKGDIIALFIDELENNRGDVMSYMRTGQHSPANYREVVEISRISTSKEVESLASELHSVGYSNIEVMKRMRSPKSW